jgi:penicillin-binding protein 1C
MPFLRRLFRTRRARIALSATIAALCAAALLRCGPLPEGLLDARQAPSSLVVDRQGVPLYEALGDGGVRSRPMTADAIPPLLAAATVAAEDHRFWSHPGIDPIAVARAAWRNLRARRVVEGGSTLTQQTAKLLLARRHPARHRGVGAKLEEAIIALRLEHRLGKREILAMYLSLASYGNQIAGAERASQAYFGRTADMLTPAQAAFLAGLPQRPSAFNPFRRMDLATRRQRLVLQRMETARLLTPAQAAEARAERLSLRGNSAAFLAPHFVEMVLARTEGARPARIETTIDAGLQREIAGIIRSHAPALQRHAAGNVAVVVFDNQRGEWLAWEGSGAWLDAERDGAINGPVTPRQPGSTLKPFTYALAFEQGFTPASVLADIPVHFPTPDTGILYSPRNYDGRYRGPMLARRALAGSENVPAVSLASELGVPSLLRFLTRAGLTTFDKGASYYGLGLTLGNAEIRLDQLTAAYAAFARGGEWIEPAYLRGVAGRRTERLVAPRTAFWISDVLSDAEAREFIFGRGGSLDFPFPVAVKTGTSQAYHDNWTIGYTPDVTVGIWVGNFDRTPLRNSSGVTGAAPIFHAVLLAAQSRVSAAPRAFARPDDGGLVAREICALSGMTPNDWCPSRRREWLTAPGSSAPPCSWHHLTDEGLHVVWPAPYRQWAETQRRAEGGAPRPAMPAVRASGPRPATSTALEIASPPSGATYLIDPTLRREFQSVPLRVTTERPTDIVWSINGRVVGNSTSEAALTWPLVPGTHQITARDAGGRSAAATIIVR